MIERPKTGYIQDDFLLTVAEVATMCRCSRSTITKLVKANQFPAPLRLGCLRRWRIGQIRVWQLRQTAFANTESGAQHDH